MKASPAHVSGYHFPSCWSINTALNRVAGKLTGLAGTKAGTFIMTPLKRGSQDTGYRDHREHAAAFASAPP